ncbi:MAG TPA: Gfo/Idh/MocA family oxidoreductase [Phycisphaerales bacterium]|nr:Gfo/Idh/MocA family oxidoreductase [Phycisphaerales bacterium]
MTGSALSRRDFIACSAAAAGAAAGLPALSWARAGRAGDVIRLGVIGCGFYGQGTLRNIVRRAAEESVAVQRVCDVHRPRLNQAARLSGVPAERATPEYRDVLDDKEVDAVLIATPDHWHAKIAIEALEAGKAVLVETPLSHTIEQALALRDAARRTGGVLAVGARQCSDDRYWKLRDAVAAGRIGPVCWSEDSFCVNPRAALFARPINESASVDEQRPDHLWWDRWLGHEWGLAPRVEFDPERFFHFQKFYDYSSGMAGELLFGVLSALLVALAGPDGEEPQSVVCAGGLYQLTDGRETPDQLVAVLGYGGKHSITLAASALNDTRLGTIVRGRHGTATFGEETVEIREQGAFHPEFRGANKDRVEAGMVQNSEGFWVPDPPKGEVGFALTPEPRRDTLGNFFDAVRGAAAPHCGIELACSTMIAVKMISESQRRRKVLLWDSASATLAES